MMKKGILLTLCMLVAGVAQADEDWLVRRLRACEKGSDDWACRHFEESMAKKGCDSKEEEISVKKTETKVKKQETKTVETVGKAPVKPKVKAAMKKPEKTLKELSAGMSNRPHFQHKH